jgi:hypothetical protein
VYLLAYPFTFFCLVTAKLLVLDRLTEFSKLKAHASSRWNLFSRILLWTIFVGNVVGLCCNIAGSVFFLQLADSYEQFASTNVTSNEVVHSSDTEFKFFKGAQMSGFFFGFEVIMLPLIVIAFFVVGIASVRRIRAAMTNVKTVPLTTMSGDRAVDTEVYGRAPEARFTSGHRLKRQIAGTCGILFVSFSIRTAFSFMLAIASVFRKGGATTRCDEGLNGNFAGLMLVWILYTPELFVFVTLLCQPVTLLVTLWGMTSGQTIAVMRAGSLDQNS